ncbi:hypothetical protein [Sinimarinibacterium thermocellulolyticum]|jgi:hypothetical protein|uniref:Uncharacterized protein n=1 Tax=Sinimarinibacterium thermocellulolyticum TaxID=3170016 RepID=A0ABV2ACW6_9GAMM
MSSDVLVTIAHVRAAGLCVHGTRTWFARQGLDFRAFLARGLPASTLLATGDAMAQRVVEVARQCHEEPR